MGQPGWKQTLRTRPARILLLVSALLIVLTWHLLNPPTSSVIPFTYDTSQGSVRFETMVAGKMHPMEFDTLVTKTELGRRLYKQLLQEEMGIDKLSPSAEFVLGSYRTQLFYDQIDESALDPHSEGALGIDLFAPSRGFQGEYVRRGVRLTLDFKTNLCLLEDGPKLEPLHLPPGTVQAPLLRDGDGPYYLVLPLNNGASYRFDLGIGSRDVILPKGSVLFPARQGLSYVDAVGIVPVTLAMSGQDLTAQAVALPDSPETGVLGMSLLANYRVVLDFRNRRLYLEPANSPSEF